MITKITHLKSLKLFEISLLTILVISIICSSHVSAAIKLPQLISDGMILQRDKAIVIWGWANPGEQVKLVFKGNSYSTKTNTNGKWNITLQAQKAGGPFDMEISGENTITVKDILFGDVWICSGQSNMGFKMLKVKDKYADYVSSSTNSEIRQFLVEEKLSPNKLDDVKSDGWILASPESVLNFSAVGYFFARKLYEQYHIPIGLITTAFGGTPVDGWMSDEGLNAFPDKLQNVAYYKDPIKLDAAKNKDKAMLESWYRNIKANDVGLPVQGRAWIDKELDISMWPTISIPGYWGNQGIGPDERLIYFRKDVVITNVNGLDEATLYLGNIRGEDTTYVNGIKVGAIRNINSTRVYKIPSGVLKSGKNSIAIRVLNMDGSGGFVTGKPYKLDMAGTTYSLEGNWQYKTAVKADSIATESMFKEKDIPTLLFNGMVAPLINYAIKGVTWYQGEHDINRATEYGNLFPFLIKDWRAQFNQGDFPFLFVQLPAYSYGYVDPEPSQSNIADLREAQSRALSLPNTGMVVTLDVGEYNDIHPLNKLDVGNRLSLLARSMVYNEKDLEFSGPVLKTVQIKGKEIILSFDHIGSGLVTKNGSELKSFAIAGTDKKYHWAKARIEGNKVIVSSADVSKPIAVRYAWVNDTGIANLYNREGLPAAPFRTDNWTDLKNK